MDNLSDIDSISKDMLEDYVIKSFIVLISFLKFHGILGIQLKYKFVTSPTKLYTIYSSCLWIVNIICATDCAIHCTTNFGTIVPDVDTILQIGIFFNGYINSYLAFQSVFIEGHKKSQIFVKLQNIDRYLKVNDDVKVKQSTKMFRVALLASGVGVPIAVTWLYVFTVHFMKSYSISYFIANSLSLTSVPLISMIISQMYYVSVRIRFLHNCLKNGTNVRRKHKYLQKNVAVVDPKLTEEPGITEDTLRAMYSILDSFRDLMDVNQTIIFLYICQTLGCQILSTQNLVSTLGSQMALNYVPFIGSFHYSLFFTVFTVAMCQVVQSYTDTLASCRDICTVLITTTDKDVKENAKRMITLIDGKRDPTVFNIFKLNSTLPLNLLGIVASYSVVLLQLTAL